MSANRLDIFDKTPNDCRNIEAFVAEVQEWLSDTRPVDAREAVEAVFAVLSRRVPEGQIAKVKDALPKTIRAAWDGVDDRLIAASIDLAQAGEQPPA